MGEFIDIKDTTNGVFPLVDIYPCQWKEVHPDPQVRLYFRPVGPVLRFQSVFNFVASASYELVGYFREFSVNFEDFLDGLALCNVVMLRSRGRSSRGGGLGAQGLTGQPWAPQSRETCQECIQCCLYYFLWRLRSLSGHPSVFYFISQTVLLQDMW